MIIRNTTISLFKLTPPETDFIVAACRKYCPFAVHRFLEPACGTGRLLTELGAHGYQVTGFDLSGPALSYLRQRLTRRRLRAEIFEADMSDFRLTRPVDAAYCTVSTFRYLLTEQAARTHLHCIAGSLRPGGIYVLGFRLLSLDRERARRWTDRRGETRVTVTLRVLRIDRTSRIVNGMVHLLVRRRSKEFRLRHEFQVRRTQQSNLNCCWIPFRCWNCVTCTDFGTMLSIRFCWMTKWVTLYSF